MTSWTAKTDNDLMSLIARDDHAAFRELHERISARVVWRIRRSLVDFAQSEEVAQEVFLEVWQSAAKFQSHRSSVSTWIFTIAHRRAVDRVRAAQSSHSRDVRVGLRDAPRDFDQVAEAGEISVEFRRVQRAMSGLTELQRETIELIYTDGLTQTEAATMLGLPVGTVKTRLRDGLARLRRDLAHPPLQGLAGLTAV